jgi:tRNA(fMet)-specific endonuclease VapC
MVMLMVDTCFLIDYQREVKAKRRGKVADFLGAHSEERLQISPVAWGEFLAGFPGEDDEFIGFVRDRVEIVSLELEVSSIYRSVYRNLKANGNLIGANDLWIASHALAREQALVSRNTSDFRRIPELRLLEY